MGDVIERVSKTGRRSYCARVRRTGYPHLYATFYHKDDALEWIQQEEREIQRRKFLSKLRNTRRTEERNVQNEE